MKKERIRRSSIVMNKVNGKEYLIDHVESGIGYAVEILDEDQENDQNQKKADEVQITETNCLAFRVVKEADDYEIPQGYTVEDGIIKKDGSPVCEQGNVKVKDILAVLPDYLILTVPVSKEDDDEEHDPDEVDLMSYQISRDRFFRVECGNVMSPELVAYIGKAALVKSGKMVTETVKEDDSDTEKTIEKFVGGKLFKILLYNGRPCAAAMLDLDVPAMDIILAKKDQDADDCEIFYLMDKDIDFENQAIIDRKGGKIMTLEITNGKIVDSQTFEKKPSHFDWSPMYKTWVLKNDEELYIPSKGVYLSSPVIQKLTEYPVLIDITRNNEDMEFTFSDSNYQFASIISTRTPDRGYLVHSK